MRDRLPVLKLIVVYAVLVAALIYIFMGGSHLPLMYRVAVILSMCCFILLVRIAAGPSAPDRALATDIIGLVIIGFCAVLYIKTSRSFYLDIALAWALQSFIGILALAKYLEGKKFDD